MTYLPGSSTPSEPDQIPPHQIGFPMDFHHEIQQAPELANTDGEPQDRPARRVYPLDAHNLTEEQIAVAFAMTSRRPEPFDEIAQQVSQEKAADFHERWVLGYGHASVAEHAVVHLAVEDISRLACDALEDNRLASYTEKSSRYQVMPDGSYYVPRELDDEPQLKREYVRACEALFQGYLRLIDGCLSHLRETNPRSEEERDAAYGLRLRRIATDSCRAVLPAATLTNVGVTANARVLEHAISKLLSSGLDEERDLGQEVLQQARAITPTLIKYAQPNEYLKQTLETQQQLSQSYVTNWQAERSAEGLEPVDAKTRLIHWDSQAEEKITAALLFRSSDQAYSEVWQRVVDMAPEERRKIIGKCLSGLGPHDAPVREFELVDYTFEFMLDYGAYRELKRHRMMSYIPQPVTVNHGYSIPQLIKDAGLESSFQEALGPAEDAFKAVYKQRPLVAQYLVTHAHNQRVLAKMNLRECYHLFKLRTSQLAHFAIRRPVMEAMKLAVDTHPELFRSLNLRDYPAWWPFQGPD